MAYASEVEHPGMARVSSMRTQESHEFIRGSAKGRVQYVQDAWTEQVLNTMDALTAFHSDRRVIRSGNEKEENEK